MRKIEGDHGYETAPKKWAQPEDGLYLFVEIYDPNGPKDEPLVRKRRIGFVKGTKPYEKAANLEIGQCMLVLGMPRLNLELVAWRLGLGVTKPHDASVLKWNVPYEMVIVGIYDDQPKPCGPGRE